MDQIYKTDLNELFSYQRKGEKLEEKEKVIEIEIERLRDFKEHEEVEITSVSSAFYNERQRVQIDLSKVLEQERSSVSDRTAKSSRTVRLVCSRGYHSGRRHGYPEGRSHEIASCDETEKLFLQQISRWVQSSM